MKLKRIFERKETKYIIKKETFDAFFQDLLAYMSVDEYGKHTIFSLYFDTDDYTFIQHSLTKPTYKEKFRVRSYGVPGEDALVFLEIKKKVKGIVYKRRVPISYQEYQEWQETGVLPIGLADTQIGKEIAWLFAQNPDLRPRVMIAYDRLSLFESEESAFRVTFDQKIRYRQTDLHFSQEPQDALVAPEVDVLMEVKALGAYPLWFVSLLDTHDIRKASFSKYAQTYERYVFMKEGKEYVR